MPHPGLAQNPVPGVICMRKPHTFVHMCQSQCYACAARAFYISNCLPLSQAPRTENAIIGKAGFDQVGSTSHHIPLHTGDAILKGQLPDPQ